MTVRHSVIMICYNQEHFIEAALDSVLCERIKPDEIIIGDDASTDGTLKILDQYAAKYPKIIKVISHATNLGIFGNLNSVAPYATGDMVHFLSGDDWFKPGLIEKMNKTILDMKLEPRKSRFILLPHVILHYLDGSEVTIKNNTKKLMRYGAVGAVLRDVVHTRQVGYSRALFDLWPMFPEYSQIIGPWADRLQHVMFAQHIDRQIVMDCDGSVYRVGVGVASRTKRQELMKSYQRALIGLENIHKCGGLELNCVDRKYLDFHKNATQLSIAYSVELLKNTLRSAVSLAAASIVDVGYIIKGLYQAHRSMAVRLIRKVSQDHSEKGSA